MLLEITTTKDKLNASATWKNSTKTKLYHRLHAEKNGLR